ncbi:MAG: F0F1 ATP synthase subunit gamma [Micavibrio aeruginosavorus]|uniref:ATP synthase gamma chain n=1 Tax=Micavibrio aeruginosavorus TaxID=349221 RepID=A0A2W5FTX8_9BACT|nr:MAG: F0F1 ATP synthase subunit gamma [Micavibrio aeruginosavorus]
MPSLRQYRDRIASVKSTRKITSAMKMVAASKLKRAQEYAQASQPYAQAMAEMLSRVAANVTGSTGPKLLVGTGQEQKHLLIVMTSDRGLAGGFNSNLIRFARNEAKRLAAEGKEVKIVTVGRKARDSMKRDLSENILESITGLGGKKRLGFGEARVISDIIMREFNAENFDVCSLIYNQFVNVMVQKPTAQQLIPFSIPAPGVANQNAAVPEAAKGPVSPYSFEPSEEEILEQLLPKNISIQIFRALLDSSAGEHAARMTAMDAATRNAGDMIKRLSLEYNRARQAAITKELIEIISGAEAV